jgi:hypothetical protein
MTRSGCAALLLCLFSAAAAAQKPASPGTWAATLQASGIGLLALRPPLAAAVDSNLWYRCISLGVPRSMMPLADQATGRIVQAPGHVAIQLEMMHEARVIPLESACQEGNYPLRNMLSAQRAEERQAAPPPDLEGVWSFATLTPLERPAELAGRAHFTSEEAAAFERATLARRPPALNALNDFWFERGPMANIDDRWPTSLIVDPADGRLPAPTADAEERRARRARARGALVDVRAFSLSERCLRSAAGPPYLPGAPDGNVIRITHGGDHVAISQEKFGETRIVAVDGRPHLPPAIRSWMGDSRGQWDGETLVVRTTNFADALEGSNRFDRNLRLVERFTRIGADTLRYEFTVDDPTVFSTPWTAALPMRRIRGDQMYEFACHEGNYSLAHMLSAARAEQAAQTAPSPVAADGVDSAVARAWTDAGAQTGWLAPDARPQYAINENWVFTEAKPSSPTGLPAFRFSALTSGVLRRLPEPRVPFAIVLDSAAIADDALDGAGRFMNLHAVYLSRTPVTDAALGPDRLPPNVRVLYLGQTNVTDAGVKQLARLVELHHLRLSVTAVTDAGLRDVARLRTLQWLNLESTQVGDAGVKELLRLPALRILHLGGTQVTDAGLMDLAKLTSLRIVRLPRSKVTANGAAALRTSRPDVDVFGM